MKQLSILLLLVTLRLVTFGQVYQEMPQYGYRANRMAFDSTLQIPTFCGVPTLKSVVKTTKNGALAFDSCNNKLYQYNPKTLTWSEIGGGSNGLPIGGSAGQILTKVDSTDFNATWQDNYADWTSQVKHIVKNNGTGLITKGTAVYVTSSNGTNMLVGKASNTSEATSSKTMGLMQTDITTTGGTQTGFVITEGLLGGLNTQSATAGDPVWLGVNGALIYGLTNKPYAPAHLVFIGIVTKVSSGNGEIFVKVQNGFEFKEIHDVDLITNTPVQNDIVVYDTATSLWKNNSVFAIADTSTKFATKTNLTNYVNLTTAQTIAGQKTFSSAIKIPTTGSQLILSILSDGTIASMPTSTYPSPTELAYVKGVTSNIQTQFGNKLNISDTASMLSPYIRTNIANGNFLTKVNVNDTSNMLSPYARTNVVNASLATKLNATDTASLSNRINNKPTNLDLLQLMGYTIKAEPYGITLKDLTAQLQISSGRLHFYPFYWNVSDSIRGVSWFNRTNTTTNQNNYNGCGIYSLSGGTLNRIVFTANDSTFWDATSNTWSTKTIPTTFLSKGIYFFAYQISAVTGVGTLPTILAGDPIVIGESLGISPQSPPSVVNPNGIKYSTYIINSSTTIPSSVAMSTTLGTTNVPYFMFY